MAYKINVPIFSMRMAGFLMYNGCLLVDIAPNKKIPGRDVYYFIDTPELHRRQKEYLELEKETRNEGEMNGKTVYITNNHKRAN